MARLDPLISRLHANPSGELRFQTEAVPMLQTARGSTALLKQRLDTSQIVSAFAETVPRPLKSAFPGEGPQTWTYAAPSGLVRITFLKRGERVSASVRAIAQAAGAPTQKDSGPAAVPEPEPEPTNVRSAGPAMPIPRPAPAAPGGDGWAPKGDGDRAVPNLRVVRATPEVPYAIPADAADAMERLLELMLQRGASDLHLTSDTVPIFRIDGDMVPEPEWRPIARDRLESMLMSILPQRNREEWERQHDTDFAHETPKGRFRVNVFADRKGIGAVFRHIPSTIRTAEELSLSPAILDLCGLNKGLVLVTGPTGSGKSTTLAAMIDYINRTRSDHIITIEDPIEFVHPNRRCLINQREVGVHTSSFKQALRAALREDPDVILVGELRDLETIGIALETAETGHLVFGTLHTNTAPSTVDRIIDQFPADRQPQIRTMLSESLKGVVAQTLCKKIGGGRVAAQEILLVTNAVANTIREGKTFQLQSAMQTGRALGMCTLNDALLDLVKRNLVEPHVALQKAVARAELRTLLERAGFKPDEEPEAAAPVAAVG